MKSRNPQSLYQVSTGFLVFFRKVLALIKQFKNKIIVIMKIFLYWKNSGKYVF